MKFILIYVLFAFFSTQVTGQVLPVRDMPSEFKTDGCSWFPDGNYRDCCVEHDKSYYFGGPLKERKKADKILYDCVKSKKGKIFASAMWIGVRIGGVSFLPTPFRWGFGNKWPAKEPEKDKTDGLDKPIGQ